VKRKRRKDLKVAKRPVALRGKKLVEEERLKQRRRKRGEGERAQRLMTK